MSNAAQKRAIKNYRARLTQRGFKRFEVMALESDRELIRSLAPHLRGASRWSGSQLAMALRATTLSSSLAAAVGSHQRYRRSTSSSAAGEKGNVCLASSGSCGSAAPPRSCSFAGTRFTV